MIKNYNEFVSEKFDYTKQKIKKTTIKELKRGDVVCFCKRNMYLHDTNVGDLMSGTIFRVTDYKDMKKLIFSDSNCIIRIYSKKYFDEPISWCQIENGFNKYVGLVSSDEQFLNDFLGYSINDVNDLKKFLAENK